MIFRYERRYIIDGKFFTHSPWALATKTTTLNSTRALASTLNCPQGNAKEQVACLRNINPGDITLKQWYITDSAGYVQVPFAPIIDGTFLPTSDNIEALINARQKKPLIIGFTQNEGFYFVLYKLQEYFMNLNKSVEDFTHANLKVKF